MSKCSLSGQHTERWHLVKPSRLINAQIFPMTKCQMTAIKSHIDSGNYFSLRFSFFLGLTHETCRERNIQLCPASITQIPFRQFIKYFVYIEWLIYQSKILKLHQIRIFVVFFWTYGECKGKHFHQVRKINTSPYCFTLLCVIRGIVWPFFRFNRKLLAFSLHYNWIWSVMWPCANSIIFVPCLGNFTHVTLHIQN